MSLSRPTGAPAPGRVHAADFSPLPRKSVVWWSEDL